MPQLARDARHPIRLILNGREVVGEAEPNLLLSDFLRGELGATGTHVGCEHGVCGACTVQLDGAAVRSCLCLAHQAQGRRVDTIEGLGGADARLGPLQEAFHQAFALQCGFCTPGFLMSLDALLAEVPDPTEAQIRDALSGNLCRCTGYAEIVAAALAAARQIREGKTTVNEDST